MSKRLATRHRRASARQYAGMVEPIVESQAERILASHDSGLLERTCTQWQFGDWQSLAQIDCDELQYHQKPAKLASTSINRPSQTHHRNSRDHLSMIRPKKKDSTNPVVTDKAETKLPTLFAELEKIRQEEMQRLQILHLEKLRQSETARLQVEAELEAFEEKYAELDERFRTESKQINVELSQARDALLTAQQSLIELNKKTVRAESQRDTLEQERRRLLECLRAEETHSGEAQKEREAERKDLNARQSRLEEALANANDNRKQLELVCAGLTERLVALESQRDALEQERRSLLERLQVQAARYDEARQTLEDERNFYRQGMLLAEQKFHATEGGFLRRLGQAQQGKGGWHRLLGWPGAIWSALASKSNQGDAWMKQIEERFARQGVTEAEIHIRRYAGTSVDLATGLTRLARLALVDDTQQALRLGRDAVQADPRPFRRKWLAFMLFDAGHIDQAYDLLASLPTGSDLKPSERNKMEYIAGWHRLLHGQFYLPETRTRSEYTPQPGRILYVAASSLPYHSRGYTLRTHALLRSLQQEGADILCVTRPGYPQDRADSQPAEVAGARVIDGVRYETLAGPHRRKLGLDRYLLESAEILAAKATAEKASAIHAASNYESALPALIAARQLGIPFIYEVRGLWEYTAASKKLGWEQSQRFALESCLEALTAKNADQVLTLTQALAQELVSRGVDANRIALVPNAVNPSDWTPLAANPQLAATLGIGKEDFVVGYVGSLVAYEGLDDLILAIKLLQNRLPQARALIVGDGDALPQLKRAAQEYGLGGQVIFAGKIAPDAVCSYYALMHAVALPRKPVTVCQLVSPLKPLEAMALRLPLVVSDVVALREMVKDGETALVHIAGNARSLADCIELLAKKPEITSQLGENAWRHVTTQRTWKQVTAPILDGYHRLAGANKPEAQPLTRPDAQTPVESTTSTAIAPVIDLKPIPLPPGKNALNNDQKMLLDQKLKQATIQGDEVLRSFLAAQSAERSKAFVAFCQLRAAQACLDQGLEDEAIHLTEETLQKDTSSTSLRSAARIYHNAARLERAEALANQLEQALKEVKPSDRKFIDEVRGRAQLAAWAALPAQPRSIPVSPKRVLNLLAFSLPYTSVGYATRSHGLAIGIKNAGWDIRPYTRPGFPYDFKPELEGQSLPEQDEIDGITYRRIFDFDRKNMSEVQYLHAAIDHYERIIRAETPEVVHAASNYVTALPAMIAARRLGVPFVYEVRGFWEVTRSSRDEQFENTAKYRFMQLFEGLTARHADRVITITSAMKEELMARGVLEERIAIAYNSVDPGRFVPRPCSQQLAAQLGIPENVPVIGYVGSFVDYEGLDDLVTACLGLKSNGYEFRLLLVGDGAVFDDLKQQVAESGLNDKAILTGRVPHERVEAYYSLIDIAPFPRKPWEVCELVSPLKPYEAMALEKAVVVSSTRALTEIVTHESNGLVSAKGDVKDLQAKLERLLTDSDLKVSLGKTARQWIEQERSWDVAGWVCANSYIEAV